jgi:hypothetical protein
VPSSATAPYYILTLDDVRFEHASGAEGVDCDGAMQPALQWMRGLEDAQYPGPGYVVRHTPP